MDLGSRTSIGNVKSFEDVVGKTPGMGLRDENFCLTGEKALEAQSTCDIHFPRLLKGRKEVR
jgi:hypothetical protein